MKKIISLLFLFIIVTVHTELHQLFKIPMLLEHYFEHHKKEPDLSFLAFVSEHYSEEHQHSSSENREHARLPFKSHDCSATYVTLVFVGNAAQSIPKPIISALEIIPIYQGIFYSSADLNAIWQPPKMA